jgi:hypothetical protein
LAGLVVVVVVVVVTTTVLPRPLLWLLSERKNGITLAVWMSIEKFEGLLEP